MNKGLYRTIFSKKHNTMIAVSETTLNPGKGRQAGSAAQRATAVSDDLFPRFKATLKAIVCSLVSVSLVLPAHAQIIADKTAPKNQQSVILKTPAGAPQVNIQTPNARGLSHNRYTQFDIDAKGAVLNNDRNSNPFLAKGSAQLILNEVRGNASKLGGMITIGGRKADVIIANPNGITVNGGGFKNVGHGILTTGTPQIGKDGALTGFDVRQGQFTVGAAGWNDKGGADYTEVLARAVALQGKLRSKNLAVSTGVQKVDYESGAISAGVATDGKPAFALDSAALGGMYADSITLIANEKGVGVKNAGTLEASRQLIVSSSGAIENKGRIATTAQGSDAVPTYLSIATGETGEDGRFVSDGGRIESKGLLVIDAGGDLVLRNGAQVQNISSRPSATVLDAGRRLAIEGKADVSNSKGAVYLTAQGDTATKDARIQAGTALHSASKGNTALSSNTRISGENITVLSNGSIDSAALIEAKDTAHLEAGKPLSLQEQTPASDIRLNGGSVKAGKNIVLLADGRAGVKTSQLITEGNLYIHADKDLNLNADKDLAARNISLKTGGAAHIGGSGTTLAAADNIEAEAGSLQIDAAHLNTASGNIRLNALKNGIKLNKVKLNADRNIDISALRGDIVSDDLHAAATGGRVSALAEGNADFNGTGTLSAKTDVRAGSVGKGRLKTDNTAIHSSAGDVHLISGNHMQLGDGKQRNSIRGGHIHIRNRGGNAVLNNLTLHARSGALAIHSNRALTIENTELASLHNMQISAQNERITLNQVNAHSQQHMSLIAKGRHSGQIWQNDKRPTANTLTAEGVLSLQSRYGQIADNTTLRAGALNLSAGSVLIKRGKIDWRTAATKVLQDNAQLKPLAGKMHIESAIGTLTIEPTDRISAQTDLTVKTGGKLLLAAKSGNAGVASAQISILESAGNMQLIAGEADIKGARISAGKNLTIAATKGRLNIEAVNTTFRHHLPTPKAAELNQKSQELAQQIAQLQKSSPNSKLIPTLQEERTRLAFYAQAVNKEVKGKRAQGSEYRQARLSANNIDLISSQGIRISAADINAAQKLNIRAAGILPQTAGSDAAAIRIEGMTDRYEIGKPTYQSHYDKAALNKPGRLTGRTGINLYAAADHPDARIIISASELKAPAGSIDIKARSDILLASGQNDAYTYLRTKGKSGRIIKKTKFTEDRNHLIMPAPAELSAGSSISLHSGGSIEADTTRFNAPSGKISLIAGEGLQLLATEGIHQHQLDISKSRRIIGIKAGKSHYSKTELNETKLPVRLIAQTASTRSGWDTVLEGTEFKTTLAGADIQAGVGEKARADAKIIFKGIVERLQTEEKTDSNSTVWQKQAGSGSTIETLKLPSFESPEPPKLSAPGGYIADIPQGRLKTEIEKLAQHPEYAYLKQLQTAQNTDWHQVRLAYDKWDYKQEGLTGAGAALIALAVAAATAGSGTGAALGLKGTAAASADAAFASLATQASISLINNKGNIGNTLKELGRSSTVKNLIVAAATAGVSDKIGASSALQVSDTQWINKLTVNLANAGSAALIDSAVNGGSTKDKLEAAILSALVDTAHGEVSGKIKQLDRHYIAHKIAHAVAGCAAAAANKRKCQDGAIGAAVGEIVGEALVKNANFSNMTPEQLDQEVKKITAYAKLAAGTIAGMTGGDVNTATQTAQNAVENNAVKAVVTAAKVIYKTAKKGLKKGKINTKDLKQTLKDEGYDLADNLITLSDGTLDWNDAKAVIDIVVGTELNKANKGEAAKRIKETLDKNRPYISNKGSVPNMSTYMKHNPFGKQLSQISEKTKFQYQGQSVYKVKVSQGDLKLGDQFYLDAQHKNHLEIFDKNGNFKFVLNMDGSRNEAKISASQGRKLNLK